jgi:TetR/AcrR family transcriptional regulator of autoinduction and epiphytic fitness
MKTSKIQQAQTRQQIVRQAVELIGLHGIDAVTMKQIARAAGIGDATIYKYFPNKEKLLLAFFEIAMQDAMEQSLATPDFAQFSLHEKLQRMIDAILENLLAEREFVAICKTELMKSPLLLVGDNFPGQALLKQHVLQFLSEAEQSGEIAECAFKSFISGLFGDYLFAILNYWLKDESEEFSDTTQLVDLSLSVLVLALKSGLFNKISELGLFIVRKQLSRLLQPGSSLIDLLQLARRGLAG